MVELANTWQFDHWPKGGSVVVARTIPHGEICWVTRGGVTFNETWNYGDALGGRAANHYNFLSMTRQQVVGGAWYPTSLAPADPCGVHEEASPFYCDVTASQAWEAWTDR